MMAALAAKTVDAMVNVEPYNVIAVADGIGSDLMDFSGVDAMPVFMATTPDFVQAKPDVIVAYPVIGADGVHLGTVDRVEGGRIKLTKADSGEGRHKSHHHFIDLGLVADVEGQKVRLSANAAVAVTLEEERSGKPT